MPTKVNEENLTWAEAFEQMKLGQAVKLPEWGGAWIWDKEDQTIVIFTKEGEVVDIRDSDRMEATYTFIGKNTWKIVKARTELTAEAHDQLLHWREARNS